MKRALLFILLVASAHGYAEDQTLPACDVLSELWVTKYYDKLYPNWEKEPLECAKPESELTSWEKVSIITARAAYVLDQTIFDRTNLPAEPILYYGEIKAPPASMLDWIYDRSDGIVYDLKTKNTHAERKRNGTGYVHLRPEDYHLDQPMEMGIGLAGQLIHESRHLGLTKYDHVKCKLPDTEGKNCDSTINEDFETGGSHAIAALWLSWIVTRSNWPQVEKNKAEETVRWVMEFRINESFEIKNEFALRYLGKPL